MFAVPILVMALQSMTFYIDLRKFEITSEVEKMKRGFVPWQA